MSSDARPWILGISASHNGSVCILKGDEIIVAVQEERLSRLKRHRIFAADSSLALAYCLSFAGIEPRDLRLVVFCIQGRSQDQIHDIRRNPLLNVIANQIPTLFIPHHYGHALSAFATSGFDEAAILVVDGAGSPIADLTPGEQKVIHGNQDDAWETISLYSASDTSLEPLEKVISDSVDLLCDGKIIGWFDGRSEFGPRALGQRSILCDPRRPNAKEVLNSRVKRREAFRPFAPAVLLEEAEKWFEFGDTSSESPFMLRVCRLKADRKDEVPAIVHVDGTGRLQTLTREANGRFY